MKEKQNTGRSINPYCPGCAWAFEKDMFDIEKNLKELPQTPGVYLHKDRLGQVIYVGKAVNLRNRVRQYFQESRNMDAKVKAMVSHIAEFEYITTATEMEALILECNLIKRYQPKYNILLRDDKTYPYIKVTMREKYPRVIKTRRVVNDGAKYYGPYSDVGAVNRIVDVLSDIHRLKRCAAQKFPPDARPCLNYHIEKCRGCCMGSVDEEEYKSSIRRVNAFLSGDTATVRKEMEEEIREAAETLNFERAAKRRDDLFALDAISEKQRVVLRSEKDMDLVLSMKSGNRIYAVLFYVREGKLSGRESFPMQSEGMDDVPEVISSFIKQYYPDLTTGPAEILTDVQLPDEEALEGYLSDLWERKVIINLPEKGEKKALMDLARKDIVEMAKTIDERAEAKREREENLQKEIDWFFEKLSDAVHGYRAEAYDISDINGIDSVGAMVCFDGMKMLKQDYRRFKVRTVEGPDDYGSMQEVIFRRFSRMQKGDESFRKAPDFLLIDGGKGHVHAVNKMMQAMQLAIPVFGMAKDDSHRTRALVYEKNGDFHELDIKNRPLLFKYLGTVQEEVHRFAIDYHRSLRTKNMLTSVLDGIEGIGPVKRNALLAYFKSTDAVKNASLEELMKVEGITEKNAENILKYFGR